MFHPKLIQIHFPFLTIAPIYKQQNEYHPFDNVNYHCCSFIGHYKLLVRACYSYDNVNRSCYNCDGFHKAHGSFVHKNHQPFMNLLVTFTHPVRRGFNGVQTGLTQRSHRHAQMLLRKPYPLLRLG